MNSPKFRFLRVELHRVYYKWTHFHRSWHISVEILNGFQQVYLCYYLNSSIEISAEVFAVGLEKNTLVNPSFPLYFWRIFQWVPGAILARFSAELPKRKSEVYDRVWRCSRRLLSISVEFLKKKKNLEFLEIHLTGFLVNLLTSGCCQ